MITLSEVSEVLEEIIPACTNSHIQKIHQPAADTIIFFLRKPGLSLPLLISAHPQYARLHLLSQKVSNAPEPPSFCQYLRAHLLGGRIRRIAQTPNDRIIWFEIERSGQHYVLVVALIGRSANMFVLDAHTNVLRALKSDRQAIGENFQLASPPFKPDTSKGENPPTTLFDSWPISQRIEQQYLSDAQTGIEEQLHQRELTATRKQVKKQQRRVLALKQDLEKVSRYREYGRYGELLKSHAAMIGKGQSHITVVDYFDDQLPEITLPLDPEKNGQANLQDYFKKYRKFTGAERNLQPRLIDAEQELAIFQEHLREVEAGKILITKTSEQPPSYSEIQTMNPERTKTAPKTATPYRRFISIDGHPILVGKSAKDNDTLTFRVSKPDDLWLHARGTPGSHVVIELEKGQSVPHETLKDAATLALFYSDLRKSGKGEVVHTLRKHVRKAKGQKPGSVILSQDKTVWVYVDQARLDRLKHSPSSTT
ncbi:MAG: NFACT family protein [Nitrospirota bacterium]|nr:NFACT family protein [Nitrospirota bacterium]